MKNTSFERVWTKTSIKRMLKTYVEKIKNDLVWTYFLCNSCPEFKLLWENEEYREQILMLAKKSNITNYIGRVNTSSSALFISHNNENQKRIRIKFLQHEICRLSKK